MTLHSQHGTLRSGRRVAELRARWEARAWDPRSELAAWALQALVYLVCITGACLLASTLFP